MATFYPEYPLAGLKGAEYNPRRIDAESLEALRHSLATLGIAKPIIVSDGLIVAGHQRTRALQTLGYEFAPAILLENVGISDEIRFNQLHNGTDFDSGDENAHVPAATGSAVAFRFEELPA
jgi:ParB family transcriptional regulator, chromosome partitioning protein